MSRILVIAPKRVAEGTWSREVEKWQHLSSLRISIVLGALSERKKALTAPADIYVINRENVQWLVDYYTKPPHEGGKWPFDCVVIDELSSFKNHQAKRFRSLCTVRPLVKRVIGLTGTPAPNGLIDLWAQVYLLDRGERLYKRIGQYRERYFAPDKRNQQTVWTWKLREGSEQAIRDKIGDICMSMRAADYLTLPDKIIADVPVVLDKPALAAYKKLEQEMLLELEDTTIDAGTAAVLTNKLLQLGNGNLYDGSGEAHHIHDCKAEAFKELVESLNGQHALVFYGFRSDLPMLEAAGTALGLRWRKLESDEDVQDWNAGKLDLLFAHPASCAYGLNMQDGGHHAIWFCPTWSLELYEQANARLHRQGQTETVIIHRLLVQGGVDEDVVAALEGKTTVQEALMEKLKILVDKRQN